MKSLIGDWLNIFSGHVKPRHPNSYSKSAMPMAGPSLALKVQLRLPRSAGEWTDIRADDEPLSANFVKIAINVAHRPNSDTNALPESTALVWRTRANLALGIRSSCAVTEIFGSWGQSEQTAQAQFRIKATAEPRSHHYLVCHTLNGIGGKDSFGKETIHFYL